MKKQDKIAFLQISAEGGQIAFQEGLGLGGMISFDNSF